MSDMSWALFGGMRWGSARLTAASSLLVSLPKPAYGLRTA